MTQYVVVVGTDTGVGKTVVASGLARAMVRAGRRVVAVKPVESGCVAGEPEAQEDGCALAAATGQGSPRAALVRLRLPVAPALAAERERVTIDVAALAAHIRALGEGTDYVLVEGAGGLLSPLSWTADVTHLAHALGGDAVHVLVVGSDRLGTIHHGRAAVQVLADSSLVARGVLLSAPAVSDASTGTNAAALRRCLAPFGSLAERVAELPRVRDLDAAADALAHVCAWFP